MGLRGQSSAEYVFAVALALSFIVAGAVVGLRETEFNLAVATARSAGFKESVLAGERFVGVTYSVEGGEVVLNPRFFDGDSVNFAEGVAAKRIAAEVGKTVAPSALLTEEGSPPKTRYCVKAVNYRYCVDGAG